LRGAQSKDPEGRYLTHNVGTFSTTKAQARTLEVEKVRKKRHESQPHRGGSITAQGEDAKRATNVCIALCVKGEALG
jgi:hypothetical protein